jgi:predicted aldo/keto reductase-like oxidoreductase
MNRRRFLQSAAALAAAHSALESYSAPPANGNIVLRSLGKTGEKISMIGLGGYDLGMAREEKQALRMMDRALDLGATFFDNAWGYHDGLSEERMGKALAAAGKRQKVFLMTKVPGRDAATAQKQLEDSLRRMQTDVIDLWQFHNLASFQDVDTIFGPRGAMEVAQKAKKDGKIRYIGFTGHTAPEVHLAMLERYDWDTVMMPINPADAHWHSFQNQVLPKALEKKCGILAFKTLSRGRALTRAYTVAESLRYVWSLPVSVLISGMDRMEFLETNLELAMKFEPMSAAEKQALLARVKPLAGSEIEYYKKQVTRNRPA